jgi:drug/metabolite transporter (DMT)-like permease
VGQISSKGRHLLAVLGLVLAAMIWGGSFVVMKATVQTGLSVGAMLSLRFTFGAIALGIGILVLRIPIRRQDVMDGVWLGLVVSTLYWLNADGLRFTTATKSGFITGLYVLFTPLASLLFRERLSLAHGFGAVVAVAGLFLLVHQPGVAFGGWNRGDSETFGNAVASGFHIAMISHFSRRSNGFILAFVQITVAMVLSWFLTAVLPPALTTSGTQLGGFAGMSALLRQTSVWVMLLYQGLLATGLAFFLMCTCQSYVSATEAAIIYCLEVVFTALLAVGGLVPGVKESLGPIQMLGGALILAAMLVVELGSRWIPTGRAAGERAIG